MSPLGLVFKLNIQMAYVHRRIEIIDDKKIITYENTPFLVSDEEIKPGDLYFAERNQGLMLLSCKEVNKEGNWIVPTTHDYCYDICECIKIKDVYYDNF